MLSQKAITEINRNIAKYPKNQKQSAVIAALAIAQNEYGWINSDTIQEISEILNMPPIAVQEVATFYSMYDTQPIGKFKITVCESLSCSLSENIGEYLKKKLNINYNETTKSGLFTLKKSECMGACGDAPVIILNNKIMYSLMNRKKVDILLDDLNNQMQREKK